jgi:transcriptional regulator with XRE-family HTH domain
MSKRKNEMPELVLNVGNKINEIINAKKLKQREVAHDAGLDVENLRKYIKGKQEMKISTMLKIVDALKIEINELFE